MAKYCIFCKDGQTFADHVAICPKCDNFLKQKNDMNTTKRRDEFEDYFDILPEVSSPLSNSGPEIMHQTLEKPKKKVENKERATIGRVRNFHEEEVYSPFLFKWFRSFFKGIPFVYGHTLNTFQLYANDDSDIGYDVIFYGKMTRGRIADFNRVKVYGKSNHSNSIVAKQIINLNSGSAVGVNYLFPAFMVRMITAILIVLTISVVYTIITIDWEALIASAVNGFIALLLSLVEPLLLLLIIGLVFWYMIGGIFRRK